MKKKLGSAKKNALLEGVLEVGDGDLGIENHVITAPKKQAIRPERKTAKVGVYVTTTEKKDFIGSLGRAYDPYGKLSESDVCRELIAYMMGKTTDNKNVRAFIIEQINNNN